VARSSRRRRGTLSAFRRPVITDPTFWIAAGAALLIGAFVGVAVDALTGGQATALGLAVPLVCGVVALWLSFKLLAMGMSTGRALEEAQPADEPRAQALEDRGRAAGAAVGRSAAAFVNRRKGATPSTAPPVASSAPAPGADPEPAEPVTVDKAARVLGSMVGRRLGDRRKDEQ
jgi:hypothetical protein